MLVLWEVPGPVLKVPLESVKVGTYTPSEKVLVAVIDPDVPLIVTVLWPALARTLAVKITVALDVVGFGEIVAVTPAGRPETLRFTAPEKPYEP
jgi:hypothetical protein